MPELEAVQPVISLQRGWSTIPKKNELLIERYKSKEGYHLFFYPFEGYLVHEGLAALLGYRISNITPISFSISINDYGFELLSDQPIPLTEALENNLFGSVNLIDDILASLNSSEMAKRQFREIARIAGLVIQGFPGQEKTAKQIQASSSLFFEVFKKYDPDNLFLKQATREVLDRQLESERLKAALNRLAENKLKIVELENPSPLAFPIMVNRLRANISSEKLADRVKRMQLSLVKKADRKDSKEYKLTKKK
jgi:ATP-dependent Lhr-like helicase